MLRLIQLPPYHPNCKCKIEIYDSNDNIIYETPEKQYIQSSKSDSSDNTPWYGNGIKELIDDPLGTIKKHGINFLEEIPLTNYLEAAFGYDLYGNKLDSDERLGKVNTAVQQGMDALLSAYMMGGINVVGGAGKLKPQNLVDDLAKIGVKYNPNNVVAVTKTSNGKLVWLEKGNSSAGLKHITERHASQFAAKGINESQIPEYLIKALTEGKIVGMQRTRPI